MEDAGALLLGSARNALLYSRNFRGPLLCCEFAKAALNPRVTVANGWKVHLVPD